MAEKQNRMCIEVSGEQQQQQQQQPRGTLSSTRELNLYDLLIALVYPILFPEQGNTAPLLQRIKTSVSLNAPLIPEASRNTTHDLLLWTLAGSPLRPLLVISVGTITLVALSGLLVFALFFLFATVNAIVVSLLMYLAVAGGFLSLFFSFVIAIYIGALSVAILTISTVTFWTVMAFMITIGWMGFFFTWLLVAIKSLGIAKDLVNTTGSAISTYSTAWCTRNLDHQD